LKKKNLKKVLGIVTVYMNTYQDTDFSELLPGSDSSPHRRSLLTVYINTYKDNDFSELVAGRTELEQGRGI